LGNTINFYQPIPHYTEQTITMVLLAFRPIKKDTSPVKIWSNTKMELWELLGKLLPISTLMSKKEYHVKVGG
jgi:hypothetical protein